MGIGNIFVATTLAPLVVVLASMSLNLLLLGMETIKKCKLMRRQRMTPVTLGTQNFDALVSVYCGLEVEYCTMPCVAKKNS